MIHDKFEFLLKKTTSSRKTKKRALNIPRALSNINKYVIDAKNWA